MPDKLERSPIHQISPLRRRSDLSLVWCPLMRSGRKVSGSVKLSTTTPASSASAQQKRLRKYAQQAPHRQRTG